MDISRALSQINNIHRNCPELTIDDVLPIFSSSAEEEEKEKNTLRQKPKK